jgi:hypothetical protein
MNVFDNVVTDPSSFAWRDVRGQDKWTEFTPSFTSLTVVGATNYTARFRVVGKQCFFQLKISAATSIASTAGTTYFTLPKTAMGLAGTLAMGNDTTKINVGSGHIDVTNSRGYLPSQVASGNTFLIAGWFEV